jgi:hypothetical protein
MLNSTASLWLGVGLDDDARAKGFVLTCVEHADGAVKLDARRLQLIGR